MQPRTCAELGRVLSPSILPLSTGPLHVPSAAAPLLLPSSSPSSPYSSCSSCCQVRKLEFLLAAAAAGGHDCVVTIGGIQSNHARATAVAARYLGLDCHLILRTSRQVGTRD